MNERFCVLIPISLKFVPKCPIINKSALVQVMAWLRPGDKPLLEPMLTQFTDAYMRHYGRWVVPLVMGIATFRTLRYQRDCTGLRSPCKKCPRRVSKFIGCIWRIISQSPRDDLINTNTWVSTSHLNFQYIFALLQLTKPLRGNTHDKQWSGVPIHPCIMAVYYTITESIYWNIKFHDNKTIVRHADYGLAGRRCKLT